MKQKIKKIISGGQTGVDQGALEAALFLNIEIGGFCPKGRLCEEGVIPQKYPLTETESSEYFVRTEKNIIHSDATLILTNTPKLTGGTKLTKILSKKNEKPCLILDINEKINIQYFLKWITDYKIKILNVAGPRESKAKGIFNKTINYLTELLK